MWQNLDISEQRKVLTQTGERTGLLENSIEKDWWVCTILKSLFETSCRDSLMFKGGTSLSKGWGLIDRFSEDVDLSIHHSFFKIDKTNKNQKDKLRKAGRKYVHEVLSAELVERLKAKGVRNFNIENVTTITRNGIVEPIDSDKDPTVILVYYDSVLKEGNPYVRPVVKIEVSCLSMDEPFEFRKIKTMISEQFEEVDSDTDSVIRTVVPTRTFLEKAFLLNEEFQKDHPRFKRMSRHLYDLERMMDTPYGMDALRDKDLYNRIIEHRKTYYAVKYVDYSLHAPSSIKICPPDAEMDRWKADYNAMRQSFIYGDSLPFDRLMERMRELEDRFHNLTFREGIN